MTVRHVVCFTWAADATPEAIAATELALRTLPDLIPGIRAFSCLLYTSPSPRDRS